MDNLHTYTWCTAPTTSLCHQGRPVTRLIDMSAIEKLSAVFHIVESNSINAVRTYLETFKASNDRIMTSD